MRPRNYRSAVLDLGRHTEDAIDVRNDRPGLDRRETGVEEDQPDAAGRVRRRERCQRLRLHQAHLAELVLQEDLALFGAMPAEMHDVGPMAQQQALQIGNSHCPMLDDREPISIFGLSQRLIDRAWTSASRRAGQVEGGVGG